MNTLPKYSKSKSAFETDEEYSFRWYSYRMKHKYGINIKKFLEEHGNKCFVCGRTAEEAETRKKRLCVDHDHVSGKIRGLLCVNCNAALGQVKDSIERLEQLIDYLKCNLSTIQ